MNQYRWLVLIATVISTGLNTLNDFIIYSSLFDWLLIGLNPRLILHTQKVMKVR